MSREKFIEALRRQSTDLENHVIDEYLAGYIDRRQFLRHGSVFGMASVLGGVIGASAAGSRAYADGKPGGTVRVAITTPAGAINPVLVADSAGGTMLQQTGEYLIIDDPDLKLRPVLATGWKPNPTADVWTFSIRKNVKFQNGQLMTADDVVATFERLSDPKNASNALSVFQGVLSKGGTRKVDDYTVEFHLDAPNGNFPYYVSSDNYNAIILPADYAGDFQKNFMATGPFKLEKYTTNVGASFVRNPDYWGPKALPDRVEFTFYTDQQSQILAMQGRQVDVIAQFSVVGGQALLNNPNVNVISLRSSSTSQIHMRCDMGPFQDKRVRRALALTLDRVGIIKGLFHGTADLGNDSPFAPVFPSTNSSVPQRHQDLAQARELLHAAGVPSGTTVHLTTEQFLEIPELAVIMQNAAESVGVKIDLKLESQSAYYGNSTFGQSDWLDSQMGITDYAHRGVPNILLAAPLMSNGTWNAAHFKNKEYDSLVGQYVKALDLQSQRDVSGKIETLLLDETPIIYAYFYDFLTATAPNLKGVQPNASSLLFLDRAYFT